MRFLTLALIATTALAEDGITRGDALRRREYQTSATQTLYVDPTGSDANACTLGGTNACSTLAGALSKLPRFIRNNVTINIGAGTYTETFRVQGFALEAGTAGSTQPTLTIQGTMSSFTVATGSNSGTVTSYAAPLNGTHAIITDSTQTWTVNDLRGRYVLATGGPGSGEYHLITSNTATTISLAYQFTASPTAATTYSIVTPSSIFTGTSASIRGMTGSGTLVVSDVSIQPTSGSAFSMTMNTAQVTTTRVRIVSAASGIITASSPTTGALSWSANQTFVSAALGSGVLLSNNTRGLFTELFVYCSGTCPGTGLFTQAVNSGFSFLTGTISGAFEFMIQLNSNPAAQSTGLWLDCTSPTAVGITFPPAADTTVRTGIGWAANVGPFFNGCLTGYHLRVPSLTYIDNGNTFTGVTNAVILENGAKAVIEVGPFTSGVTNFLTIDGTVYTDAQLTTYTRIVTPQGSHATRP